MGAQETGRKSRFRMKIKILAQIIGNLLSGLIGTYQLVISPILAGSCRYQPTCSQYALDAIDLHGPFRRAAGWRSGVLPDVIPGDHRDLTRFPQEKQKLGEKIIGIPLRRMLSVLHHGTGTAISGRRTLPHHEHGKRLG